MNKQTGLLVSLGLALAPVAWAHHSGAVYDTSKTVTLTGTVKEWLWTNPHCALVFEVKDAAGKVTEWSGETTPPADIGAKGWTRKMFTVGGEVTVTLNPGRHGEPIGRIVNVVVNGKTSGGAAPGPAPGSPPQSTPRY
jgi:hypothetical protein